MQGILDEQRGKPPTQRGGRPAALSLEERAVRLARQLQVRANTALTPEEAVRLEEIAAMVRCPSDKAAMLLIIDQAFRPRNASRGVDQLRHLLDTCGIPQCLSIWERTGLRLLRQAGNMVAPLAYPLARRKIREDALPVIWPSQDQALRESLRNRLRDGVRVNINRLGEEVLGEEEARRRLVHYMELLTRPEVEVVSVKVSTLFSQITQLAHRYAVAVLADRLERLFEVATENTFVRPNGERVPKFVYLDMESYRDLRLTAEAFMMALDRPGMRQVSAGMVLQAYLPEARSLQEEINAWARIRVLKGGAPIRLRIVKGANLEMEQIEAAHAGWPVTPFTNKVDTDANFKCMLETAMVTENMAAVHPGVGTHNLYDLAYAIEMARERRVAAFVRFEMLEGMANHQCRVLQELTGNLMMYAPACGESDFINAISYLIRRLDENSGEESFLRHAFGLQPDDPNWDRLEKGFRQSVHRMIGISNRPHRQQDRLVQPQRPAIPEDWRQFVNDPPTDFSQRHNVDWAETLVRDWLPRAGTRAAVITPTIAGKEMFNQDNLFTSRDPSRVDTVVARVVRAGPEEVRTAVDCAVADPTCWRSMPLNDRRKFLAGAAQELRKTRPELIEAAMADGGKTLEEADHEVSEAIDFTEFYPRCVQELHDVHTLRSDPIGVVAVVTPWNFPIAIPAGGIAAALAAGNTVILKPASETVLPAERVCECFWRAGISKKVLQLVPCSAAIAETHLLARPDVSGIIFTGSTRAARGLMYRNPDLRMQAETGGKNATVVTALADRDQAIRHVLESAFSHAGQKCSATSLLLLEREVFEDEEFKDKLRDAVESLYVGSVWELHTLIPPVIRIPSGKIRIARRQLQAGEEWLVPPAVSSVNPRLLSPAVKWNIRPGSAGHLNELFGPVLGVMVFDGLDEAIRLIHQTGYGLTAGLESLDEREQEFFQRHVNAGNMYLNRPTTGARVLRQPFGGMGLSRVGSGLKVGGPHYVTCFMRFEDNGDPEGHAVRDARLRQLQERIPAVEPALRSYVHWARKEFQAEHDSFRLRGQDNIRRYRLMERMCICLHDHDTPLEIAARLGAVMALGGRPLVTGPGAEEWTAFADIAHDLVVSRHDRLRYARPEYVPQTVRAIAAEVGVHVADRPVLKEGRVELLNYLEEQTISIDYHRHGNLGSRAEEHRAPVQG